MNIKTTLIKRQTIGNITIELVQENDNYVIYHIEHEECLSSESTIHYNEALDIYNETIENIK